MNGLDSIQSCFQLFCLVVKLKQNLSIILNSLPQHHNIMHLRGLRDFSWGPNHLSKKEVKRPDYWSIKTIPAIENFHLNDL